MNQFENTKFSGGDYDEAKDKLRLIGQMRRIFDYMVSIQDNGTYVTLAEISAMTGAPVNSISAALRAFRNQHGYDVQVKRDGGGKNMSGLHFYRLGAYVGKPKKKMKPIGDPKLWGEYMRSLYAFANARTWENHQDIERALIAWSEDFKLKIFKQVENGTAPEIIAG